MVHALGTVILPHALKQMEHLITNISLSPERRTLQFDKGDAPVDLGKSDA
jgi:hypothetical protein